MSKEDEQSKNPGEPEGKKPKETPDTQIPKPEEKGKQPRKRREKKRIPRTPEKSKETSGPSAQVPIESEQLAEEILAVEGALETLGKTLENTPEGPEHDRIAEQLAALTERFGQLRETQVQLLMDPTVRLGETMRMQADIAQRQILMAAEQVPEGLKVPTAERLAEIRGVNVANITDQDLMEFAGDWFEQHLRFLESFEQTFESQPALLEPLQRTMSYFEHREGTKHFGSQLRRKLEARRIRQALVRVWEGNPPEAIMNSSSALTTDMMKELFTIKDHDGNPVVANEFKNLERMARIHRELVLAAEDKRNSARKEVLKDQAKALEEKIINYARRGGRTAEDEQRIANLEALPNKTTDQIDELRRLKATLFVNAEIDRLAAIPDKSPAEERTLQELRDQYWARKFAGGLWSLTLRASYWNIKLTGTGDQFGKRLFNFVDELKKDGLAQKTKGVWAPEGGQPFDLGLTDYFSGIVAQAKGKDGIDTRWLATVAGLSDADLDIERGGELDEKDPRKDKDVVKSIRTLEHSNIGSDAFWDEAVSEFGVGPDQYGGMAFGYFMADNTRKVLMGPDSLFHNPSLDKFLKLIDAFQHVPQKEKVINLGGKREKVSARQAAWQDMLDRIMKWSKSKEAKELIEQWKIFPEAEKYAWIEESADAEMLTNNQRDYLLRKYLGFGPISSFSAEGGAKIRSLLSVILGPFRYGPMRTIVAFGFLGNGIKETFKYVFSE